MEHCVSTHHGTHYITNIGTQHLKSVIVNYLAEKTFESQYIYTHLHTYVNLHVKKTYVCAYVNINLVGEQFDFVDGNKYKLNGKKSSRGLS